MLYIANQRTHMERRRYLASVASIASLGLAGCLDQAAEDSADTGDDPSPTDTKTPASMPGMLQAGDYTVELSNPQVRASVLEMVTHVDVRAKPDMQFLVLTASSDGPAIDELPLSVVADGVPVVQQVSSVRHPDSETNSEETVTVPVPVDEYDTVAFVLEAGGESDRFAVPDSVVTALGTAPEFTVESFDVPASVTHGDTFEASFTVANDGTRDARFLTEFGHGQASDTGEVSVAVPAGEQRTHTGTIEPHYGPESDVVPVVLDWGLDRRRIDVAIEDG